MNNPSSLFVREVNWNNWNQLNISIWHTCVRMHVWISVNWRRSNTFPSRDSAFATGAYARWRALRNCWRCWKTLKVDDWMFVNLTPPSSSLLPRKGWVIHAPPFLSILSSAAYPPPPFADLTDLSSAYDF